MAQEVEYWDIVSVSTCGETIYGLVEGIARRFTKALKLLSARVRSSIFRTDNGLFGRVWLWPWVLVSEFAQGEREGAAPRSTSRSSCQRYVHASMDIRDTHRSLERIFNRARTCLQSFHCKSQREFCRPIYRSPHAKYRSELAIHKKESIERWDLSKTGLSLVRISLAENAFKG